MRTRSGDLLSKERRTAYVLLLPSLLILFLIMIYPLGSVIYTSFTNRVFAGTKQSSFVGMANYRKLLGVTVRELPLTGTDDSGKAAYASPAEVLPTQPIRFKELSQFSLMGRRYVIGASEPKFIQAIGDTLAFTIISVVLEAAFGLFIALFLNSRFKGRGAMRVAMLLPWAIPTAVSSRMWEWILAPTRAGFFNVAAQFLFGTDGQFSFLTEPSTQLWAMVLIDVWKTTPFMSLLLLAGLQMIPGALYEASRVDGAGPARQFFSITLPMVRTSLLVAVVFRSLDALRVFDLFQIIFGSKRYSMSSFTYYQLIDSKAMGYSSASSLIIFVILFVVSFLYVRMMGGMGNAEND